MYSGSVAFLACFLAEHPLPDTAVVRAAGGTLPPAMLDGVGGVAWSSYPLRSQLLHFLLPAPCHDFKGGTGAGSGRKMEAHHNVKPPDCMEYKLEQSARWEG